jgi:8-oxo-dGTP pyrophosphatase MutT (NUDIX family)
MASSNYTTIQYTSDAFVESCGAVLFNIPERKVCLVRYTPTGEWLLPKGRRNCGESRKEAALREVLEETGYECDLHPVTMSTRAPSKAETGNVADQARTLTNLTEPFMVTIRNLEEQNRKFIWWYIAVLSKHAATNKSDGEDAFIAEFFSWEKAVQTLSFKDDRIILEKAIELVKGPC